jgi:hypothetical protein
MSRGSCRFSTVGFCIGFLLMVTVQPGCTKAKPSAVDISPSPYSFEGSADLDSATKILRFSGNYQCNNLAYLDEFAFLVDGVECDKIKLVETGNSSKDFVLNSATLTTGSHAYQLIGRVSTRGSGGQLKLADGRVEVP